MRATGFWARVLANAATTKSLKTASEKCATALPFGAKGRHATSRLPRRASARRGFTVVEMMVALVIFSAAIVAVASTVATVTKQHHLSERRAWATQEAANILERIFALPAAARTPDAFAKLALSAACQERLPDGKLKVTLQPSGDQWAGQQVVVEVDWREPNGDRSRPIQLTAWLYGPQEVRR